MGGGGDGKGCWSANARGTGVARAWHGLGHMSRAWRGSQGNTVKPFAKPSLPPTSAGRWATAPAAWACPPASVSPAPPRSSTGSGIMAVGHRLAAQQHGPALPAHRAAAAARPQRHGKPRRLPVMAAQGPPHLEHVSVQAPLVQMVCQGIQVVGTAACACNDSKKKMSRAEGQGHQVGVCEAAAGTGSRRQKASSEVSAPDPHKAAYAGGVPGGGGPQRGLPHQRLLRLRHAGGAARTGTHRHAGCIT